jgi:hypothetical protein
MKGPLENLTEWLCIFIHAYVSLCITRSFCSNKQIDEATTPFRYP